MSSPSRKARASGQSQAAEVAEEQALVLVEPLEEEVLPEERGRMFETMGFSRVRMTWQDGADAMVARIREVVDDAILTHFTDAYSIMSDLYDVVREQEVDQATGELVTDPYGMPVHVRTPSGGYYEDWSRLTDRQREDFLFRITTSLFAWEQRAADLWGEAMFAKAVWTEAFAIGYDAPVKGTIEDRTARANVESAEDRYFAILQSLLSRKADALVRSMTLLSQRLKDTMGS